MQAAIVGSPLGATVQARPCPPSAALAAPCRPRSSTRGRGRQPCCRPQAVGQDTSAQPGSGLQPELRAAIEEFITANKVVAFIKGTKQFPQCGFSNTVVQILNTMGVPYVTVNVLEDDLLRSGMKEFSQWPTFPQVYIQGEFFGGADIMIQAYTSGELQESLEAALNS